MKNPPYVKMVKDLRKAAQLIEDAHESSMGSVLWRESKECEGLTLAMRVVKRARRAAEGK